MRTSRALNEERTDFKEVCEETPLCEIYKLRLRRERPDPIVHSLS